MSAFGTDLYYKILRISLTTYIRCSMTPPPSDADIISENSPSIMQGSQYHRESNVFLAERGAGDDVDAGGGGGNMLSHPALSIEEDDTAEGGESRDRPDSSGKRQRCRSSPEDSVPTALPFCARSVQGGDSIDFLPAVEPAGRV